MRHATRRSLKRQAARLAEAPANASTNRLEVALEHQAETATQASPHASSDRLGAALTHHAAGDLALAENEYRQILQQDPQHPGALHLLGLIAFQTGHPEDALELIGRAIDGNPRDPDFRCNLGVVLRRMDRLEDALDSVDQAARLDPHAVKPQLERGQVLYALRRPAEALTLFEAVVAQDPQNALAHLGIAFAALLLGDFERGWAEFEFRLTYSEYAPHARGFDQLAWAGQPFPGQTLLLYAEQGLGDTLQFVRFAPQVKALGGQVVLECQPELRSVLDGAPGVDVLLTRGEALPGFDLQAPVMSLPWLLGTRLNTIPAVVPYLPAAAQRASLAGGPHLVDDGRFKVGLVWAGSAVNANDHQRSMTLQALAPLGGVANVAFFALQKGPPAAEAVVPPAGLPLTDLSSQLNDFGNTAAMLSQLDLVITVDTAVAHLAGALGRRVWLLLPFAPDFRWLLDRGDSPWYPTMRLFRQTLRTDWAGVVEEVRGALSVLADAHPPAAARTTQTGVIVALPVNSDIGWGVCGRHIATELSRLTRVRLVTDSFDATSVGDVGTYRTLTDLVCAEQDQREPLLQAITSSTDFAPFRPNLRSTSLTVGYSFFEENILPPEAIQNAARIYDHIVTGSTWCEEVLRGYKLEAVSTILQGIDPLVFHPAPTPTARRFGDRFVVFSGGKLEFRKGQDLVIRAFKVLQDRHADVLLVNAWFNPWRFSRDTMAASPYIDFPQTSADHVDFISQLLVANGIDIDGVVTLLPQPNVSMPGVYWDTDVGLFPNRCEGGSNLVLMEYMAAGQPVIAAYSSGHRDILTDQNAVLIKQMAPLLMNDDDRPIALWDDPSLDETIAHLEWAYQHPGALKPLAERAGRDLAVLTWARTATAFHTLLEPPGADPAAS